VYQRGGVIGESGKRFVPESPSPGGEKDKCTHFRNAAGRRRLMGIKGQILERLAVEGGGDGKSK